MGGSECHPPQVGSGLGTAWAIGDADDAAHRHGAVAGIDGPPFQCSRSRVGDATALQSVGRDAERWAHGCHHPAVQAWVGSLRRGRTIFFEHLEALFDSPEQWSSLPRSALSVRFRASAFKVLSKAGGGVKELLAAPHQRYPTKMFVLLEDPGAAVALLTDTPCMLDTWSRAFLSRHPTLSGPSCMQELALLAQVAMKDISAIEARHATIRRLLVSGGIQTHTLKFEDLSASWSMLQFRKRHQRQTHPQQRLSSSVNKAGLGAFGGVSAHNPSRPPPPSEFARFAQLVGQSRHAASVHIEPVRWLLMRTGSSSCVH